MDGGAVDVQGEQSPQLCGGARVGVTPAKVRADQVDLYVVPGNRLDEIPRVERAHGLLHQKRISYPTQNTLVLDSFGKFASLDSLVPHHSELG